MEKTKPIKIKIKDREQEILKQSSAGTGTKEGQALEKIGRLSVYLSVFLIPIFFLPWTNDILDFNKQALFLVLAFLGLVCWLIKTLTSSKLEINTSFLNLSVIILLLASLLSAFLSLFSSASFWGLPLPVYSSFLSLLGFSIFYFLIVHFFKKEEIPFLFFLLFLSGALAALYSVFQLFGKFILPFNFAKTISFNTVGSVNGLAIFLSVLFLALIPLFFFAKKRAKVFLGIFGSVFFIVLFLINFKTGWLILLIGAGSLFALATADFKKIGGRSFLTLTMVILMISLFLAFFRFPLPGIPSAISEVSPGQKAEIGVIKQLPAKSLIFGTGQGTFVYDWSRHKSQSVNQTAFWGTRFSAGASEVLDRIITTGILGILAFFFLLFIFFKTSLRHLLNQMSNGQRQGWLLGLTVFVSFLGAVFSFFFYPGNFSIFFVFWLLFAFLALLTEKEKKTISFSESLPKAMVFSFSFIFVIILILGASILYGQRYVAETRYFQGLIAWQKGQTDSALNYLFRATGLSPKTDLFWRDLAQVYLTKLNEVGQSQSLSQEEKNSRASSLIVSAINASQQATAQNPHDTANWNIRGFVYRNVIGLKGAEDWAINSYKEAAKLEPANPYIFTEIGRVYLAKADLAADAAGKADNLKLARENFEKAISLKSDYAPAHFLAAMVFFREGKNEEAIAKLEETKLQAPSDVGLAFQLGLIYYNDNKLDKARAEFERAVAFSPDYSNARYFLGLIYDKQGNKQRAVSQFERISELNPDNQEAKNILNNLRNGKPALEGIVQSQPPIEEKPAERLKK